MPKNPVVASYVADFLKPDMMHVYRQLTGLRNEIDAHVFTHKRHYAEHFPYHEKWLHLLPQPGMRWLRRFWYKDVLKRPWPIFRTELVKWVEDLTRIDAQVLHIYFGHVAPQFLPLMKVWKHPVVVSYHGADAGVDMDKPGYLEAARDVMKLATQLQCRSQALADDLEKLGADPKKIVIQRTGIPMDEWAFAPRQKPENGAWVFCQSCRFVEKKGLDLSVRAFAKVRERYPNSRLVLVGGGPERPKLKAIIEKLGLASSIVLTGFRSTSDVKKHVLESHVYLHPSRTGADGNREGVPNAMLEAMSTGAPVVATYHGGIPEAVTDGVNGLLVPENDHESLAQAMLRLIEDDSLRERISNAAHESIRDGFSQSGQSRLLIDRYKALMA
ncbi:MAG: glycosyltransferase [Verrucomicrobiaceae bacterium]|nr:glycosyltransferase [Verrucomicrobiaceae bacterium]